MIIQIIVSIIMIILIIFHIYIPYNTKFLGFVILPKVNNTHSMLDNIIDYDVDGKYTNKLTFDIYTLAHISAGIFLYLLFNYLGYNKKQAIFYSILISILFEIIENMQIMIDIFNYIVKFFYIDFNYTGDSIVNILTDIIANLFGIYLATILPVNISVLIFIILNIIIKYFEYKNFINKK